MTIHAKHVDRNPDLERKVRAHAVAGLGHEDIVVKLNIADMDLRRRVRAMVLKGDSAR